MKHLQFLRHQVYFSRFLKRFLTILLFLQLFQEAISIERLEFLEYYLLNILTGDLKRQQRFTSLERTTQGL